MHRLLEAFRRGRSDRLSLSHRTSPVGDSRESRLLYRRPLRLEWLEDRSLLSLAPTGVDLLPGSDTGVFDEDNLTNLDNSAAETSLDFAVSGTITGATVTLYADGVAIGSDVATDAVTTITTDGIHDLADGTHAITARQTEPGDTESADSPALAVTVDTVAPPLVEPGHCAKLLSSDGAAWDHFGFSVSIDGTVAIVGAYDTLSTGRGSAYVFEHGDSGWYEVAKLTARDGGTGEYFGASVSISGGTAIVGAYRDGDHGYWSGSAYVFQDTGSGWTQVAKLIASDSTEYDRFGESVSISGGTAIIGASGDDDLGVSSGSAYVFADNGSGWAQVAKLTASDATAYDLFGHAVSVSDNTAIVGAHGDSDFGENSGSVYVFQDGGSGWTEVAKLTAADAAAEDRFGYSVSVRDGTAIIGALTDDDRGSDSGSAYLFVDTGSGWTQIAKLTANDGAAEDHFGASVSVSGTTAIVGACRDDDSGTDSGSAYVFQHAGSAWLQAAKFTTGDGAAGDNAGVSVAVNGDLAIVGADCDDDRGSDSGSAHSFSTAPTPGLQPASDSGTSDSDRITADATPTIDVPAAPFFRVYRDGAQISGDFETGTTYTLPPQPDGTYGYTVRAVDAAGNESPSSAVLTITIDTVAPAPPEAPDLQALSDTGISDGDRITAAVTPTFDVSAAPYFRVYRDGAQISGDYETGASYSLPSQPDGTFEYSITALDVAGNESGPSEVLSVTIDTAAPEAPPAAPDLQGGSDTGVSRTDNVTNDTTPAFDVVAAPYYRVYRDGARVSGDYETGMSHTLATQADGTYDYTIRAVDAAGNESPDSAAQVVTIDTVGPRLTDLVEQTAKLIAADVATSDGLGHAVAMSGNVAIVAAPGDDDRGSDSGSAYVFERAGDGGWIQVAKLTASDGAAGDWFGCSVSISGNFAVVGAYHDDDRGSNSGSAYVFKNTGTVWTKVTKLTAGDGAAGDCFGGSVSIHGTTILVGASGDDDRGSGSGSVYVFGYNGYAWTQVAKLTASDGAADDVFGHSVAIDAGVAIVGAHGDDGGGDSGSAYVFEDTGTGWTQVAKLTAADAAAGDAFGYSLSVSGTTALIGAIGDDDHGGSSGSAYLFERTDAGWSQVAKLTAADGGPVDQFGCRVGISGTTAIVGADQDGGPDSGLAYVFEDGGFGWTQVAKLVPADAAGSDGFGSSVAISGATLLVGTPGDDDHVADSGSVYVFDATALLDRLTWDTTPEVPLAFTEAVYGQNSDVAVLDPNGDPVSPCGVVGWGTADPGLVFGLPLTLDGEYTVTFHGAGTITDVAGNGLVGGADQSMTFTLDTVPPATPPVLDLRAQSDTGVSDEDNVTKDATPTFDVTAGPYFRVYRDGIRISGDRESGISYTAPTQPDGAHEYTVMAVDAAGNESAPSAALTVTIDTTPPATPPIPDLTDGSETGVSLADDITSDTTPTIDFAAAPYYRLYRGGVGISGPYDVGESYTETELADGGYDYTVTAVDAAGNESAPSATLSVAVDTLSPALTAEEIAKLMAGDGAASDYFGSSVAISGNTAIVGAYSDDDHGSASGSAYIFEAGPSGWTQVAKLVPADGAIGDWFGRSVSISGNTAIVGAYGDDDRGTDSGSAYVFNDTGFGWAQVAKLTASDGSSIDQFGLSVSISGSTAIIGALGDNNDGAYSGSAYLFEDKGSGWTQVAKLTADDGAERDYFGCSVAISGTTAIVGAYGDDDLGSESGSVYLFEDTGSGWTQVAKFSATDGAADDRFGESVAISGTTAIVGASRDDDHGDGSGSAYVFENSGSGWTQVAKFTAPDGASGDYFGNSVSISGTKAVVGAVGDEAPDAPWGSAYLFEDLDGVWTQVDKLTAADGVPNDAFGQSVAISGDVILAGNSSDDDLGNNSGSAYLFSVGGSLTEDTGLSAHDRITSDTTPELPLPFAEPVYGDPSDVVVLDPNGDPVMPDAVSGWGTTTLVVTFSTPLTVDGEYSLTLRGADAITDAAGNPLGGGADETTTFTLQTTAPPAPAAPDLAASSDTGLFDNDNLTGAATLTFVATGAPYFRLYCDGVRVGGDYESGEYAAARPSDGVHQYTVTAVDVSGNESGQSDPLTVMIDATPPEAPSAPDLQAGSDTGIDDGDNLTADTTLTFDITAAPYYRLYRDGLLISGYYENDPSVNDGTTPADGGHDYTVTAVDLAGNESAPSEAIRVRIDTAGPMRVDRQTAKLSAFDGAAADYFAESVSISGNLAIVGARGDDDLGSASGSAHIFEYVPSGWTWVAKLNAAGGWAGDSFGCAVAVSGTTAIVGAYLDDTPGTDTGAAYVFEHTASGWSQVAMLEASDGDNDDAFGYSVSISGSTAVVGACYTDDFGANSGSAYVFKDTGSGWTQVAKLTAADAAAGDTFGYSVSISGDTVIVGAHGDDDDGASSGSAYVFADTGSGWVQVAKLTAGDAAAGDAFGRSVSISGNRAIVGAYSDDDLGSNSGSAYVFENSGSGWTEIAKLTADDGGEGDLFGSSVAISGDTVLVGAYNGVDDGIRSGAAYVFEKGESGWTQANKLIADDKADQDQFGGSVALSGKIALVGVPLDDDSGSSSGSAYVFEAIRPFSDDSGVSGHDRITNDATPEMTLVFTEPIHGGDSGVTVLDPNGDPVTPDVIAGWGSNLLSIAFTAPLAVDGEYTILLSGSGAITDAAGNPLGDGGGETLTFTVEITAPDAPAAPKLDASSDTGASDTDNVTNNTTPTIVAVGSPYFRLYRDGVQVGGHYLSGSFTDELLSDGTYEYTVTAVDASGNESVPSAPLAVTIDTVAQDAPAAPDLDAGSDSGVSSTDDLTCNTALVFDVDVAPYFRFYRDGARISGEFESGASFTATDQAGGTPEYTVTAVDAAGNESAPSAVLEVTVDLVGPQQVISRITKLLAGDGAQEDYFGYSVSIDGTTAMVGAYYDDDLGASSGSVYVFESTALGWVQVTKLTASDGTTGDYFGGSVSISGSTAIVGAFGDDDCGSNSGSAYVFRKTELEWTQVAKLTANDGAQSDAFGGSVSICGTTAIAGASGDSDHGTYSGSAYVFQDTGSGWIQVAKFTDPDGASNDNLGCSVSISGNTAIVGGRRAGGHDADSGAAFVFRDSGSGWVQVAKLVASDGVEDDYFGDSVSISGGTAIVGATFDDDHDINSGAVYVFEDTLSGWTQVAKLTASDDARQDRFGCSVSISGARAVIGAYGDDDFLSDYGSTYVFENTLSVWTQVAKLNAPDREPGDQFGECVAISGATVVIGAFGNDDLGSYSGSAYVSRVAGPLDDDTGQSLRDMVTSDTTPELTWLSSETLFGQDGAITVLDPNGDPVTPDSITGWESDTLTITFTTPLTVDGEYTVTLSGAGAITDAAGNALNDGVDEVVTFTLFTVVSAPAAPDLQASSDTGASDSDNVTADTMPTFEATGAPYYRVYRGGVLVSGYCETGEYTLAAQSDGTFDYTVTSVDAAGNESAPSPPLRVTIDTEAPAAPAAPDLQTESDLGINPTDNLTADATPTFDVTAAPFFRVYRDGVKISGDYESGSSYTDTSSADGTPVYAVTAVDAAGNESVPSASLQVTIDTVAPAWDDVTATLTTSDGAAVDQFGSNVSISGTTAIVGAYCDNAPGSNSGSAYVFEDTGSGWTQVAKLTASDGAEDDHFGCSVSISGTTVILGAYGDDSHGDFTGSAYIFENTGSGWTQVARLAAPDGASGDFFGYSVSISGTTAVVGAFDDDDRGSNSGSVYVFENTGSGWTKVAKLTASDGAADDVFGTSVSISGTTILVGAGGDDDRGSNSGSTYVFRKAGSSWTQVAKLTAADGAAGDAFGASVSISGTTVIVGAAQDDDGGSNSGSAYVFENVGSGWTQVAKLTASDGAAEDSFGYSVAITETTAIVGAWLDDDHGAESGSAYVFEVSPHGWTQVAKLAPGDGEAGDSFGCAVAVSGTTAFAGASHDDDHGASSGSVYVLNVGGVLSEDTGVSCRDQLTTDTTPALTLVFGEPVYGDDGDVSVLDPNGDPVTPGPVVSWGGTVLNITLSTPLTVDGEYTVTLRGASTIIDAAGNVIDNDGLDQTMSFTLDTIEPTVEAVLVRGTAWTDGFLDYLDAEGLAHPGVARLGYRVPTGSAQLDVLPWGNVDQITIVFDENVVIGRDDLAISGIDAAEHSVAAFSYDPATYAATWTLAERLDADMISITLSGTVEDLAGNGLEGGEFALSTNVLPGDADHSGMVDDADAAIMAAHWSSSGVTLYGDFNGDGLVDDRDASILAAHWKTRIATLVPGDANRDGTVDDRDASVLGAHWQQQSGAVWADGDFNADGKVDDKDAAILAAHWEQQASEATEPPVSSEQLGDGPVAAALIGPRPASALPATRQRLSDPHEQARAEAREAAREAAFAEASGSAPSREQRLAAAWSYEMARSNARQRLTAPGDRLVARRAVDLVMSGLDGR